MRRALLATLLLPLAAPAAAPAATWYGTVTATNDGDTFEVRIDGRARSKPVRFVGVQAMELTRYSATASRRRGPCQAVAASDLVERLVRQGRRRVRLTAEHPRTDRTGRLFRTVAVRTGGRWRDVGAELMRRGLALWMHTQGETGVNRRYNRLGQQAARRGTGIWDPRACGAGPQAGAALKVWVMSDPVGEDTADLDTEWIKVRNLGPEPVGLGGWWVRDSGLRRYTFPRGTVVEPGRTITVFSGSGQDAAGRFYWGLPGTVFENSANGGDAGDGAYLFDPRANLRAWMVYPCLVACRDPGQGTLAVTANAIRGPEYVLVKDVSPRPVDLYGYELRLPGAYAFPEGSVLQPGQAMRVFVEGDPSRDTPLTKYIGYDGAYLPDRGGSASVTTFDEIVLGCDSWGAGRC